MCSRRVIAEPTVTAHAPCFIACAASAGELNRPSAMTRYPLAQEKNLTLTPTSLQGLLIALPKVAKVAQEQVVEPKIDNPQPEEKPLGETMKDSQHDR